MADWYTGHVVNVMGEKAERSIATLAFMYASLEEITRQHTWGLHPEFPQAQMSLRESFLWAVSAIKHNASLIHSPEPSGAVSMSVTRQEVIAKVSALVNNVHGGDYQKAFNFYAKGSGTIEEGTLITILSDAGVGTGLGSRIVRYIAASEIIELLDTDGDGAIQWNEFNSVFNGAK